MFKELQKLLLCIVLIWLQANCLSNTLAYDDTSLSRPMNFFLQNDRCMAVWTKNCIGLMSIGQMSVNKIYVGQMYDGQIYFWSNVCQVNVCQVNVCQVNVCWINVSNVFLAKCLVPNDCRPNVSWPHFCRQISVRKMSIG